MDIPLRVIADIKARESLKIAVVASGSIIQIRIEKGYDEEEVVNLDTETAKKLFDALGEFLGRHYENQK